MRREGPPVNRRSRQAGIRLLVTKARHFMLRFRLSAALSALIQSKLLAPALRPGLFTDGPSGLNLAFRDRSYLAGPNLHRNTVLSLLIGLLEHRRQS